MSTLSMHHRPELRRLIVFGIVGTFNTAVCYLVFALLVHALHWNYNLALVADYAFGIWMGYALHSVATFADRKDVRQAFGKYTLTLVITFFVNLVLLDALVRFEMFDPLMAQAVAMTLVTLVSYALQKHWVFRSHAPAPVAEICEELCEEICEEICEEAEPAPRRLAA